MRSAVLAKVGARGTDSLQAIGPNQAGALRSLGFDFCVRYLGNTTPEEVTGILDAGLAYMPVTFADRFDGPSAVRSLTELGVPKSVTVWLDVEGKSVWRMDPAGLSKLINDWAGVVGDAGWMPGLYVGEPQPLTSGELFALRVVRYWHGQGRCVDRLGLLAEPTCGWCMSQMFPSVTRAGVLADVNIVGQDYRGRLPTWTIKAG